MDQDWYKWSEFRDAVLGLMPLEKSRLIQGDDGQFMERVLRLAVLDIQHYVPVYQRNHETIYLPSDFVQEMHASRAVLPPQAKIRDIWLFDTATNVRYPVTDFDWENRFELVNNRVNVKDNNGRIAISPDAYTFYLYPAVRDGWLVSMWWDGEKANFQDDEETPFEEQSAAAAADYMLGHLARYVEKDMAAYASYFHPQTGSYTEKRRQLFRTAKERTRTK